MVDFEEYYGRYVCESVEGKDAYLKEIGVGWFGRHLFPIAMGDRELEVVDEINVLKITESTPTSRHELKYTLEMDLELETLSTGEVITTTLKMEGDTVIASHVTRKDGAKSLKCERLFHGDMIVQKHSVLESPDVVCTMIFKKSFECE